MDDCRSERLSYIFPLKGRLSSKRPFNQSGMKNTIITLLFLACACAPENTFARKRALIVGVSNYVPGSGWGSLNSHNEWCGHVPERLLYHKIICPISGSAGTSNTALLKRNMLKYHHFQFYGNFLV
jgi:hypothetical protein